MSLLQWLLFRCWRVFGWEKFRAKDQSRNNFPTFNLVIPAQAGNQ